jgi:hypothetical protein
MVLPKFCISRIYPKKEQSRIYPCESNFGFGPKMDIYVIAHGSLCKHGKKLSGHMIMKRKWNYYEQEK